MAGEDFQTIDFSAAAPFTYNHDTGGGAYNNRTVGDYKDITEQLEGGQFSYGNIVTYLVQISMDENTVDPVQFAEFDFGFLAETTGQTGAAFIDIVNVAVNYGNVENGDNGTGSNPGAGSFGLDSGIFDDRQGAPSLDLNGILGSTAILVPGSEKIIDPKTGLEVDPYTPGAELRGTVRLNDLEAGEKVVLRIDVLLANQPGTFPTGNLQGALLAGRVVDSEGNFLDTINTGQQTIPLKQIGQLTPTGEPLLDIEHTVTTDLSGTDKVGVEQVILTTEGTVRHLYTVTNDGTKPLYDLQIVDDNGTPDISNDDFTVNLSNILAGSLDNLDGEAIVNDLAAGQTVVFYQDIAVSTMGTVTNNATATGNNNLLGDSLLQLTDSDAAEVVLEGTPSLDVLKTANVSEVDAAGQVITYTYIVTNTGNIALTDLTLIDDNFTPNNTSDDLTLNPASKSVDSNNVLDVGETWTYTYDYAVTQGDLDKGGQLTNIATASSTQTQPKQDDETVQIIQKPDLSVLKTANVSEVDAAGQVITYTYTVTNTGNITLTDLSLIDDNFTPNDTSDDLTLNPASKSVNSDDVLNVGETWTYSYDYAVTQDNLDIGGQLTNIATATSTQTQPKQDDETVQIIQKPDLSVLKTANVSEVDAAGQVITYTYTVTNTGNITLTDLSLIDDNFTPNNTSDDLTLNPASKSVDSDNVLDVGETWTYTYNYAVTQGDLDKGGQLTNIATASSTQTQPKQDDETVQIIQKPSIDIDKVTTDGLSTGDNIGITAGQAITWIYTVKNTGNVSLSNINLSDDKVQQQLISLVNNGDGDAILAPNETWVYQANGTAVSGNYQNLGTVTGEYSGGQITDNDSSSYLGIEAPGVRTPGFWSNWTAVWDGNTTNDTEFAGRSGFPMSDILVSPYSASTNAPKVIDPVTGESTLGILIGDYNRNGISENGEKTIFYTLNEAKSILGASNKVQDDKRYTLDRSLVASWLNFLAFNPAPIDKINEGIAWIQAHTPDENKDGLGDGNLVLGASTDKLSASSPFWNQADPVNNLASGQSIHAALDNYNNFGMS